MDLGSSGEDPITIVRDFQEVDPLAMDKHKVLQILINLLSNAKKAVNAAHGGDKRIIVSIRKIGEGLTGRIQFQVADNGVGIAGENLINIFSHGFTTRAEGHGFGLHSAANAAKEMGGELTVASEGPERGAAFTLDLPLTELTAVERMMTRKEAQPCQMN